MDWIDCLVSHGWSLRPLQLGDEDASRYALLFKNKLPPEYISASKRFSLLSTADETVWFLSALDYLEKNPTSAFAWNEFQKMCLEAAGDDSAETSEVEKFWREKTPVLLSVRSGYAYLAHDTHTGTIVLGHEPEFESIEFFASSFSVMSEDLCRFTNGQRYELAWPDLFGPQ